MKYDEVITIYEWFKNNFSQDSTKFSIEPKQTVQEAMENLQVHADESEINFFCNVAIKIGEVFYQRWNEQKLRASERINQSIKEMKLAFYLMLIIHNALYYFGIGLILYSVILVIRGGSFNSLFFGGIGVANLLYYIISEPIKGIHESTGNLMQLRTIYTSYITNNEQISDSTLDDEDVKSIPNKKGVSKLIRNYSEESLDLIEYYCEPKPGEKNGEKNGN